jgi:hypothetical protein
MELREWQYMNKPAGSTTNNSSSSGYKKRFEKLIKYHIDHASSELESVTRKDIKDDGFRLSEHHNNGHKEFDKDFVVSVDKDSDIFSVSIFIDGKEVNEFKSKGYSNFVIGIRPFMWLPDSRTSEYADLLTESLNEWQLMNPPQPASKPQSQEDRFKSLLAQIDADGISTYIVNDLTEDTLDISLTTKKKADIDIKIIYNSTSNDYSFQVGSTKPLPGCDYEKDILELFLIAGAIKNTNLCESASIADDFKLYENLWN